MGKAERTNVFNASVHREQSGLRFLSFYNDDYSESMERAPTQGPSQKKKSRVKQEVKYMLKKNYGTFNC